MYFTLESFGLLAFAQLGVFDFCNLQTPTKHALQFHGWTDSGIIQLSGQMCSNMCLETGMTFNKFDLFYNTVFIEIHP